MLSDVGWAPTSITSLGKDTGDDGIPENSLPILHKSTVVCYLSLIKSFAHPKKKSILLKWQVFLVQTARRCHPVERKTLHYKALSFIVMMENHFCTCIFNQKDLFPSPYPLPSTHSLKIHTHTHLTIYTQDSPSERGKVGRRAGAEEKSTLRKEKQKIQVFAIWYLRWEVDSYGYIRLHQFDSKHSRCLIYSTMGFNLFLSKL